MTLKELKENCNSEKVKIIVRNISNWLEPYENDIVIKVIRNHIEEIISNDYILRLLDELYVREHNEHEDFFISIRNLICVNFEKFEAFDTHGYYLTHHSKSYRDVLYDMYIDNASK